MPKAKSARVSQVDPLSLFSDDEVFVLVAYLCKFGWASLPGQCQILVEGLQNRLMGERNRRVLARVKQEAESCPKSIKKKCPRQRRR